MDATTTPENINNQLKTQLETLSAQIEAGLESGKYTLADIRAVLREKSRRTLDATQEYVESNPWKLTLTAGVLGVALGVLARDCFKD